MDKFKKLAPVVLFVFNRPWHTEQTLKHLMLNELSQKSTLFIYSDGPKADSNEEEKQKIYEVRRLIRQNLWCFEVHIIESDTNIGLAESIIHGVSKVITTFGKAIVLEDDLITSKYFLNYMNSGLDFYENRKAVFSISADRPPNKYFKIPDDYEYDAFVSLRSFSTGWGTWVDRWEKIDWTLNYLDDFSNKKEQTKAFNRGGEDLTNMLFLQKDKKIDSWAIRFNFAHFKNHSVAILPCISYVDNIGFDGSGTHSGVKSKDYRNNLSLAIENPCFPDTIYEDSRIINAFYSFFHIKKLPIYYRILNRISRLWRKGKIYKYKTRVYSK